MGLKFRGVRLRVWDLGYRVRNLGFGVLLWAWVWGVGVGCGAWGFGEHIKARATSLNST